MNAPIPIMTDVAWYLVFCKPHQEHIAENHLNTQGFHTYLPRTKQERRREGQWVEVVEPLFPRYLFIRLSATLDRWAPIRSTRGVANLVRFGIEPARVPEGLVEQIMEREGPSGLHSVIEPSLKAGDSVRVHSGAMMGYEGIFVSRSGSNRVLVLLDILERHIRVNMSIDVLEPA